MKSSYCHKRWGRLLGLLLLLLLGAASRSQAQLYYLTSDNSATTTAPNDALNSIDLNLSNPQQLAGTITSAPLLLALDIPGNRVFVGDNSNGRSIKVLTLSGSLIRSYSVPATLTALEYASGYLYFTTSDGAAAANSSDALYRILADGSTTTPETLATGIASIPGALSLNLGSNEVYVGENSTSAGRGISVFTLSGSTATFNRKIATTTVQITAIDYSPVNGYIYYLTVDGVVGNASSDDALSRVLASSSNGTTGTVMLASVGSQPNYLALDITNNRVFVFDVAAATRSFKSIAVNGNSASLTTSRNQTDVVTAIELQQSSIPTVTTTSPATSITATSATVGGTLVTSGGAALTSYGVVYIVGTSTPTLSNRTGQAVAGTSSPSSFPANFSTSLTGLTPGTQYTAVAYATNSLGTDYGDPVTFTTAALPTVTQLAPTSGPVGTSVVITGTNFAMGATVTFNSTTATTVTVNSATQITATVPTGATTGNVVVTTSAGSSPAAAANVFTVTVPTTVTSITPTTTSPTNATSVQFTVTFAASVSGLTTSNFTTSPSAGITGSSVTSVTGSGTTYTVTVNTGSGSGTLGLTLANATGISPSVSNTPFTGTPLYTIDKTAPVPTITSSTATSGSTTSTSPFSYTATFSEAVSGFAAGDITVTNGSVTSGPSGTSPGTTFTFTVTPNTAGTVTNVTVAAATVQDGVGNFNTASNTYALTFTPPTITVAPPTLPNGTVAAAYSQTLTASGGTAPYTYAITAGALPAGLSLTSAGVLSGTPTAGGSFNFTVRATDASATPGPYSGTRNYTLTIGAPTITVAPAALPNGTQGTAYSQTITASGGTAPYNFAITSGVLPAGLSLNLSNGTISGTPTVNGTFNFTVTATDASTASGPYSGSRNYSLTIAPPPSVTVVSVTRLTPSPTATAQVSYRVVFSGSVSGVTVSNFTTTNSGTTVSGSSISSTSGSGTTYTVVVNTGTGNGTLRLDVANSTGISPTVSNVPYTAGEVYTITKSFAAAPTLRIQAGGSAVGNGDVTAFVDVVQVLLSGTSTVVTNALQNGSFESNNVDPSSFRKATDAVPVVASPWSFTTLSGVSRNGSAFGSTAADGDAVALIQSAGDNNAGISQNLAVPTGSYQVSFQAMQRNYTSKDQRLNVFVNDVFVGSIQPNGNTPPTYDTFTSASFSVTAQTLVATVSTTSASPTSTAPIPFSVSFTGGSTGTAQSVGTSFTASDVTVSGGTLNIASFSGSGAGPYTFTVTPSGFGTVSVSLAANVAQDANNTGNLASNTVSVQFQAPTITIAPATLPAGTRGTAYSQTLTASGGTAPYSYAITAGALPSGLSLNLSNGTISGTPAVSGAFTFTVTATDASAAPGPYSGSRSYTLTIAAPAITLAPATLPNGTVAAAYSQAITASGGTAPYTYAITAGALPSGLTLSSAGVLSGTPTAGGSFTFTVTATDASTSGSGGPYTGSLSYTLTIAAPTIVVNPTTLPSGTRGVAYSQALSASGGTAPYTYAITAGALPAGLTLTNGTLAGTPAASGSFTFTITATDASTGSGPYTGSRSYTLTIAAPAITLSPATLPNGTVGVAYSQALSASGGTAPYTYAITAGALPAGLTLTNGTLAGTPTAGGSFTFTVTATDASTSGSGGPYTGSRSYTLTVAAPTITVAPASLPGGTRGMAYSVTFTASGGTSPYTYAITAGVLPAGLTLISGGVLFGTPTTSGSFTFTVTATDNSAASGPYSGSRSYTLVIAAPSIVFSPTSLPNGTVGTAYSQTLTASGGTAPYTYAITAGALPAGLTLASNGTLSGTPTAGGPFTFTVTATDASTSPGPYSGSQNYTLTISAPSVVVSPTSLPAGTQGTAYSQTLTASGGTAPYSFAVTAGALPAGLTLASNGTLSGTPTVNGSFTFTVTATDASTGSGPYSGSQNYTLTIAAPVVTAVGWNGSVSTDWFTAANWTPNQVPDATIDAVIPTSPSGGRFPIIGGNAAQATARNVSIATGAALTMSANMLTIAANLTNNGTFNGSLGSGSSATGGTVVLGGSAAATIGGTGTARFWNLTVGSNGTQSTLTGSASVQRVLTLNGNLATSNLPFTLVSDANGTAMVVNNGSAVVTGNLTVQRYIVPDLNPNLGYRHFSAPVRNATVGSLSTSGFTPVVNPAYNSSATPTLVVPFPTIYGYDQSRLATTTNNLNAFDKGWFSPSALSDPLTVGQGYTVNLAANQTFSLTGPQNNGNVVLNLSRNSGATAVDAGWQLIGNPYPSPLDWSQVQDAERPGLDRALYVFASNNPSNPYVGTYGFYNNGLGNISPVLPLGQGFFVRVTAGQTAASLTLKNTHRVTTYANPIYHRNAAETRPLVQLSLRGAAGTASDEAFVYFENGATAGVDSQFDAVKLANSTGLNLASFATGQQLAINGLPTGNATTVTVPLFIGLPATGTYTLNATQVLNFAAGAQPFLRDLQLGTLTDLSVNPTYTFTMNAANTTPRFELVFGPQAVLSTASAALAAQVAVFPNPATKAVFVELPASLRRTAATVALVDAVGRVVRTQAMPAGLPTHTLPLTDVATGVYSLRLQTSAGVVVKKLIVE